MEQVHARGGECLDNSATPCPEAAALARVLPAVAMRWRIEVQKRGKYWQWRYGSGRTRISRYGGKFELLSQERQTEYAQNKARNRSARDA